MSGKEIRAMEHREFQELGFDLRWTSLYYRQGSISIIVES